MVNRTKFISTILAVLFVFTGTTQAHERHKDRNKHMEHGYHYGGWHKMQRALAHLDLTDEQQQAIEKIHQTGKAERKAKHEQMRTFKKQMHELLIAEQIDSGAIKALSLQIAEEKANNLIANAEKRQQVLALLTTEQKKRLEEIKAKRHAKKLAKRQRHSN